MTRRIGATLVLCLALVPAIAAAQDVDPKQTFEVASVRPNELGAQSFLLTFRNGRYTARYHTVKQLIRSAYTLTNSQVFGAPAWLDVDRFDVLATAPATPDSPRGIIPPAVLTMLRNLLEERFRLKVHLETREYPLFALVLARPDGIWCGRCPGPNWSLASGRIVVDRTGLTGTFDIDLRWTPERPFTDGTQTPAATPSVDGNEPPLFTALQEQLGLKLERTKGPVDVLVIDHVERPTPNE